MALFQGKLESAYCVYKECPKRKEKLEKKLKHAELLKEKVLPILDKRGLVSKLACGCEDKKEMQIFTNKWPLLSFGCHMADKEKRCKLSVGAELVFNDEEDKETPTDIKILFSNKEESSAEE
jgi:hypothetical protein